MTTIDERGEGLASATEAARLARLLALDTPRGFNDVALARRVSEGLPVQSVAWVVGPVVPEFSLRRARKSRKPLSRQHSERLYELSRVLDAVDQAYHGDREKIMAFMTRPHPLLEGATPLDFARSSSAGADAVLNLLRRAEAGVAV